MDALKRHAARMIEGSPSLDREVAREYLLTKSLDFRALVIYDHPAECLMVYEIQPDADTLAKLMSCHNRYLGSTEIPEEFQAFIRDFPSRFESCKIIDNTDIRSVWRGFLHPISFIFVLGSFEDVHTKEQGQALSAARPGSGDAEVRSDL